MAPRFERVLRVPWVNIGAVIAVVVAGLVVTVRNIDGHAAHYLLNVSYDPTRELYKSIDSRFVDLYARQSGSSVAIKQSHGGSSHQASLVASGQEPADIVTLGLPSDIEGLQKRGLIAQGWRERLPNHSQPYYSTIVFVVRRGNPLAIHDWPDIVKPGVEVILPDPKTSGNGKLAALAAWGSVIVGGGNETQAKNFLKSVYDHALFLVPAARAAGVAFSVEKKGDVQLAWENEALREVAESRGAVEIVYPPQSLLAEPAVAWVDANVVKHGSAQLSTAYLEYLFTDEAQEIVATEGYRPYKAEILAKHRDRLPDIKLFPITAIAKDWSDAQQKFFAENGVIDTVYAPKPRTE